GLKLHLGGGSRKLPGWVNADSGGGDLAIDLRWTLPFQNASAQYVLASRLTERLDKKTELPRFLQEVKRVLAPGGVLRLVESHDGETLSQALREAGFADVEKSDFMASKHEALRVDDASQ